jgi:threonine-phosphate decarboxylase
MKNSASIVTAPSGIPQLRVFDTWSNFVLFKILDDRATSVQLRDYLLSQYGFYVRDCSRKLGLGDKFIRVGTNLPAENQRLVAGIRGFFK